jgi:outer membrane protein
MMGTRALQRLLAAGVIGLFASVPAAAQDPGAAPTSSAASAAPTPAPAPVAGTPTPTNADQPAPGSGAFPDTTVAGIYELALENDLNLERARADLRAGQEARKLALSGLLPQVQAGIGYAEADTEQSGRFAAGSNLFPTFHTDTDTDTDTWNVSLSQPVFDLSAWFLFQRGRELSKQAESLFSLAQQDLMLRTVRAYTGVLRAGAILRASRAQEQAFTAQLDQVRQRFDVGMVAITDVHEAKAAYDLAVAQRITDEGNLGTARELLTVLTGRPHGDLWELEDNFPVVDPEPASADDWVAFALANNYDIRVAENARDAAHENSRAAASEHLPKVDLAYTYLDSSSDIEQEDKIGGGIAAFPNDQDRGVVSLNLTMPVYTGGFLSANRRQAAANYDSQKAGYEDTVRTVTQETRAVHIQVVANVATYAARAQAVTSTKSALEAAEVGYEVGTRNVVDVLEAQRLYYSAIRDYENSVIDYVQSLTALKRLAGTLAPTDIYDLNRWLVQPAPATLNSTTPARPS